MPDTVKPVVILVNPQMGENIGMSARAMYNCGVEQLRLVNPRDGWDKNGKCYEKAMATSAECLRLMPEVQVFDSLADASTDLQAMYASTARPRYMEVNVYSPMQAGEMISQQCNSNIDVGLVFGCESSGLDNNDIALCNGIITVRLNEKFKSLNLSQAVLLLCWEWWKNHNNEMSPKRLELDTPPASQEHIQKSLQRLEQELDSRGFFKSDTSGPTVKRNLNAMFNRIHMNEQEVQMLHGIIRCLTDFDIKKD